MSKHAAPRFTRRAVPATKGPGNHAAPGGRLPLADVAAVDTTPEPLAARAPLAALVALLALLLLAVGIGTVGSSAVADVVEGPAAVTVHQAPVADWTVDTATDQPADSGTDAGLITAPAN